ncbi:MAG: HAD-IA family hydrolase [Gammaproteobacteria bacterium]
MNVRSFELLVFDWDGTLMDSQARIVNCLRGAIEDVGAAPRSDAALRDTIGLGLGEGVQLLYPGADDTFTRALSAAYRRHFLEVDQTPSPLFAGARAVVAQLKADGYWLAIATGKSHAGLQRNLRETGLDEYFHTSRCADQAPSKPHPQMLEDLTGELGVAPQRTLMIGDTAYDMEMARNASTCALAVSYGAHALNRLLEHAPLGHVNDISEVPAWILGLDSKANPRC